MSDRKLFTFKYSDGSGPTHFIGTDEELLSFTKSTFHKPEEVEIIPLNTLEKVINLFSNRRDEENGHMEFDISPIH